MSERIILTSDGTAIDLPPDLIWVDELTASKVAQRSKRSAFATLIVSAMQLSGGQQITLQGEGNSAWIERSVLLTLNAWARIPGQRFTLELRGQTYTVIFDHGTEEETKAMAMSAVVDYSDPEETDYYCSLTLRFIEASEIL